MSSKKTVQNPQLHVAIAQLAPDALEADTSLRLEARLQPMIAVSIQLNAKPPPATGK